MAKRGSSNDMQVSSSGCSNGAQKRPMQQDSDGQEHAKKKLRVGMRANYTYAPYHDGFQWRKYGQKMIRGNAFPRCYYRCTYHQDHGCPASKHVEQHNSEDPPLFRVVYTNEHTCSGGTATAAAAAAASEYMASSMQIQQIADASLRKAEMETSPPRPQPPRRGGGYAPASIKEEGDAIVSSLLTVIRGTCCNDVGARSDAAALAREVRTLSPTVARGSHEGSPVSPVQVRPAAPDDLGMEFMVESHWFEPLDLGWFMTPT